MPTYQYACTDPKCGNRFELVQSFTEPAATNCPLCAARVRKVYGSVGVVFKGSGFYRTDSRAGNGNGHTASEPASNGKSATKNSSGDSGSSTSTAAKSDAGSSSSSSSSSSSGPKAAAPA